MILEVRSPVFAGRLENLDKVAGFSRIIAVEKVTI
jgi:hypothetical protein